MQKYIKMLFTLVLAFVIILSTATGVLATEQEHVHNWQKAWSNDHWHCMVCSGCQEEQTRTHSNDSAGVCTICGHTPHKHIWQYTQGKNYDYSHGLHCTQCAATSNEDHIYGNDGKCTVCGNAPPHVHQWKWDGNKSNYLWDHFVVCSCGEKSTEPHQFSGWDGTPGNVFGHSNACAVCGFALQDQHTYDSAYYNGERCTVCGFPDQVAAKPNTKPNETTPVETKPAETEPKETTPAETKPAETEPKETTPAETKPAEIAPEETTPQKVAKEDSQRSDSVWVWVVAAIVVAGSLGSAAFFLKKNHHKKK